MKELIKDLECIIDKVVENYMVEKEYNEFIKLLKYFVEIQESKIDEVHIIVKGNSEYLIQDENGNDILEQLFSELSEARYTGTVSVEDMLISGLITNSPGKVIVHCEENCDNKELMDTIKKVFLDRVTFCSSCKICEGIKKTLKV
jgi:putative sporulation protein YtxC